MSPALRAEARSSALRDNVVDPERPKQPRRVHVTCISEG